MSGSPVVGVIREVVEWAALGIEILGVVVIVAGVLRAAITRAAVRSDSPGGEERSRHEIGRTD